MCRLGYSKKETVEQTPSITMKHLRKAGFLKGGIMSGRPKWGTIGMTVLIFEKDSRIDLHYRDTSWHSNGKSISTVSIPLISSPCRFGGLRWEFICQLEIEGKPCGRKVRAIYKVGVRFGCRLCQNLAYRSTQRTRQADRIIREAMERFYKEEQSEHP